MDTTDPDIRFDAAGCCNHCTDFLEKKIKWSYQGTVSDKALQQIVEGMKADGKGRAYDCVAGVSGGADSCYTAYICHKLGLRVLLVHMDNGWDSETSVKNIEVICRCFNFDYESHVLDWGEFRDVQLSHLKASVPEIETPTDIAILECLHKSAAKHGVKHIVMGGNYITEGILPRSWHYDAKDSTYSRGIHALHGTQKIKEFPSFNFWQEAYYKLVKGIRITYLLNYVPYKKNEAIATLEALGWKDYGQKHHESFYTRIVQSYILPVKFNIDYRKATLSNKVCTGLLSRQAALKSLEELPYNPDTIQADIDYVYKKLGITSQEFEAILKAAPKSYRDYPNSRWWLEPAYKLYRFMTGAKTS